MKKSICFLLLAAGATGGAHGQVAQSASFRVDLFTFTGGGGGVASPGNAAHVALPAMGGTVLSSPNYDAAFGFLECFDPGRTNAPIIFGITPNFGSMVGGTAITISGLNYNSFGTAPSVSVSIAGSSATGLTVVSDTIINCVTPAGPSGPNPVTVSSAFGSDTLPEGFIHAPALTGSPTVVHGGSLALTNYGPAGSAFQVFFSISPAVIPFPPFGTILIDPAFAIPIFAGVYTPPNGTTTLTIPVPNNPALVGFTGYFQTIAIVLPLPVLTNRATTTVL
ncbi:MAG TPA: IPT/TIG domain-containing protein [Planctomycetota bacterium]|nr:IPT/TIG domain-containing protein [Planctomycetota bacterium]